MPSTKKTTVVLPLIALFATPLFCSCERYNDEFGNLFERNVVWSDEEGKITITVQGGREDYGFANIDINGETIKANARFTNDYKMDRYIGIIFQTEECFVGDSSKNGRSLGLDFKESASGDSAIFEIGSFLKETEDPYYVSHSLITLSKRPITADELDARYCVNCSWYSEEIDLSFYQIDDTPYTGKMYGKYNSKDIEFFFLDDCGFKITKGEERLGEGKYASTFDGMTLSFDVYGKEEFGESRSLVWPSIIHQKNHPSSGT